MRIVSIGNPKLTVFPVPLYTSLDVSHASVRLLVLRPGKLDDNVECKLRVVELDEGLRYEALSYIWGETIRKLTVTIEGQSVEVTDNLHSALRHLRHPDRDRTLWADALCINQANLEEKAQQVGMMSRIFEDSLQCLVWLGEISARNNETPQYIIRDAEAAFDMIRLIAAVEPEGTLPANLSSSSARESAASAISGMMLWKNSWWRRIWTVQEAVLPRAKTIVWQTASVSWNTCVQAARGIMNPSTHQRRVINLLSPELFSININEFITPFISLEMTRREALERTLLTAQRWRNREATDARDKVYGLVGLLDTKSLAADTT